MTICLIPEKILQLTIYADPGTLTPHELLIIALEILTARDRNSN